MDSHDVVRAYYRALDAGEYDRLAELLAPEFVQRRPDRTFDGREAFVAFMREGRPLAETTHAVDALYDAESGTVSESGPAAGSAPEVVARGRLLDADDQVRVRFVDVHRFADGRIAELLTYTR